MKSLKIFMKRHSSLLLSVASSVGLVTSTVLAVKATPKALQLIEEEKKKRSKIVTNTVYADNQKYESQEVVYEDLSILDTIKVAWKPYIPTGISMFSTLICIFGNTYLNYKTQTSLISAYAILDRSYKEYIEKTKELYGEDADRDIRQKVASSNIDSNYIHREDKKTFFELRTMRYFESTVQDVLKAENMLNQELAATGYVSMNDFFRFLHLEQLPYADYIGWCDHGEYHEIKFEHEKMELEDGLECILIDMDAWSSDFDKCPIMFAE